MHKESGPKTRAMRGQYAPRPGRVLAHLVLIFALIAMGIPGRGWAQATDTAQHEIDAWAALQEGAIKVRLEKVLLRLTSYYHHLIDEIDPDNPNEATVLQADLQQDLQNKIAAELERHRLRITVTPISYAVAHVPVTAYRLAVSTRHSQYVLTLHHNLYTNAIEQFSFLNSAGQAATTSPFTCHHCADPLPHLTLCDHGHAVHQNCFDTCYRCGKDICLACGIQPDAIEDSMVCVDCVLPCVHCSRWISDEHICVLISAIVY